MSWGCRFLWLCVTIWVTADCSSHELFLSIPVQCELYFVKYGRGFVCLGCKSCMTNCYANKKQVCPGLVCAYAHVRIISEKNFYKKNSFSPEGKFLQKNYVVLYCVKCINICVRRCVYAHMRTGLPDSVFFCLHNFLIFTVVVL